jgi:hypothetical protein
MTVKSSSPIVDDDRVSSCEVDAQPPRPCAQQENELLGLRVVELVDADLAGGTRHTPIDPLVAPPLQHGFLSVGQQMCTS